jgi:redox-sensitive bicupin YhaK (pirin superfamily)
MSWHKAREPVCSERADALSLVIEPRARDLGGFTVRRVLPAPDRQMVGPFIFFDEMGPADFAPGQGITVRPHPHIGLSTVTYLFAGEIMHRDSLGYVQPIRPGAINLMTAGRGIVHSERTSAALQASGQYLHGIQTWMALPDGQEEIEPRFQHVPASELPVVDGAGMRATVILGAGFGVRSPVTTAIDTLYVDVLLTNGATMALPEVAEAAVYVVSGELRAGSCVLRAGTMGVIASGSQAPLNALADSRVMVIGGESPGERHVWWNFVSSSRSRIDQAKADWRAGRFAAVPGDDEFIPLPGA